MERIQDITKSCSLSVWDQKQNWGYCDSLSFLHVLKSLMVFFSIECFSYAVVIKMCRVAAVIWCAYLALVTCDAFKNDSALPAEAISTSVNKLHYPDSSSQSPKGFCSKWNLQSSTLMLVIQFKVFLSMSIVRTLSHSDICHLPSLVSLSLSFNLSVAYVVNRSPCSSHSS